MLTPTFQIAQTDDLLIVTIHAPYTQLNDVEINALGSEFLFYSSPYFLRLFFPYEVVDDDEPSTKFIADNGDFEVILRKKEAGQHFPDLDLLGTLLAPRKQKLNIKPSIEVLTGQNCDEEEDEDHDVDEWFIDQEIQPTVASDLLSAPKYGFGNSTQGVFQQVKSEFKEIIDLPDPDITPASQRDELRIAEEDKKFCSDHYLADFMEPDEIEIYLAYMPFWMNSNFSFEGLSGEEKETLKKLGNKEFLLSKEDKKAVWFSLVDIIFSYAYNYRTTMGENTVESAWTINKMSATLSWFTNYKSLHDVIVTCFRRLLTYPLYRNYDLALLVLQDTIGILKLGRRQILKCLLEVHSMFSQSEPRYLLNQLYISDYCIWLQKASDNMLNKLVMNLEQVKITKKNVGFDLEELEQAALLVQQEEEEKVLVKKISDLNLMNCNISSSSDSDSSITGDSDDESSSLDSDDESSPET